MAFSISKGKCEEWWNSNMLDTVGPSVKYFILESLNVLIDLCWVCVAFLMTSTKQLLKEIEVWWENIICDDK